MKKGWTDIVKCPDPECGADVWVAYYPGYAAQTYGPPERCWEFGDDVLDTETAMCNRCGRLFTRLDIHEWCDQLRELNKNYKEHYQEERDRRDTDE